MINRRYTTQKTRELIKAENQLLTGSMYKRAVFLAKKYNFSPRTISQIIRDEPGMPQRKKAALSPQEVNEILDRYQKSELTVEMHKHKAIASEFGISWSAVRSVVVAAKAKTEAPKAKRERIINYNLEHY